MNTATDAIARQSEDARRATMLNRMIENFTRQWAPSNRDEAACFSADLFSLVRTIYIDAQEPGHRHVQKIMEGMIFTTSPLTTLGDQNKRVGQPYNKDGIG